MLPREPDSPPVSTNRSRQPTSDAENEQNAVVGALSSLTEELRNLSSRISSYKRPSSLYPTTNPPQIHDISYASFTPNIDEQTHKRRRHDADSGTRPAHGFDTTARSYAADLRCFLESDVLLNELLNAYFSRIHPWVPIMQERAFRTKVVQAIERNKLEIVLYGMLVATLRFLDTERLPWPAHSTKSVSGIARNHVLLNGMNTLSVESLQALIIVAFTDVSVFYFLLS